MRVVVPSVSGTNPKVDLPRKEWGILVLHHVDEASDSFSELIRKIVVASEMEATLKRLLEEIEQQEKS